VSFALVWIGCLFVSIAAALGREMGMVLKCFGDLAGVEKGYF